MRHFWAITGWALVLSSATVRAQDQAAASSQAPEIFKVCGPKNPPPCATAPRATFTPDPEYSDKARKKKKHGTVTMEFVLGTDGRPHDIRVTHGVGYGLDEKAVQALRNWKFETATKDGQAVPVWLSVEMEFRLY